jgi:hypothetical protein
MYISSLLNASYNDKLWLIQVILLFYNNIYVVYANGEKMLLLLHYKLDAIYRWEILNAASYKKCKIMAVMVTYHRIF